jgi:hypothetical protein
MSKTMWSKGCGRSLHGAQVEDRATSLDGEKVIPIILNRGYLSHRITAMWELQVPVATAV